MTILLLCLYAWLALVLLAIFGATGFVVWKIARWLFTLIFG